MDAVKFIEERNRMCKSFGDRCTGCPASDACGCCAVDQAVDQASTLDATAQVAIVEKWSAAHPRKTRQDVFLEQYPEADAIDEYGVLRICPMGISAAHRDNDGSCKNPEKMCIDCRLEFWMQEVEDENKIECRQCKYLMFSDKEKELAQNAKREYARKWRAENRDKVKAANERYWLRRAAKTMAAADEPENEVF